MKVFGITGWKNSGKTGLTERLVAYFTAAGLRVSTIKHTHHAVDIDQPGTDSFRHRAAGAAEVILASDSRMVLMREARATPPTLEALIARLAPVDLVLVEGYKSAPHLKIECLRAETGQPPLYPQNDTICALACDQPQASALPQFSLDDTAGIAAFITDRLGIQGAR
ncbi:molybdopterin-guanine dinucleotide biosynthesis protein B [Cognatishimia sp. SS12]|uniref:molybdopterin-guanine dinucleotide biosynthesis protein B n=1 Tax=Cognatishimia sp. SS12 TaxID=2979465 RepID=UPI00232F567A|nr:molybdopterin-guanine dinucleotide biosynthesis protein B [Cognatishimia sp. SS12]MDC0739084.1 molybdopterin-guanine dinucleotide biosynthesis protein B [Cognatishimia sp. SS12]